MEVGFAHSEQWFERIEGRIDALQRTLIQSSVVTTAALIGLIATQL